MNKGWKKKWEYAMYKGDELLAFGTREEICKQMNIKEQTFRVYRSNAYKKRTILKNSGDYYKSSK